MCFPGDGSLAFKQLVKSNTNAETIPPLKVSTDNGEDYYFTDEEKANCLNDFFYFYSNG